MDITRYRPFVLLTIAIAAVLLAASRSSHAGSANVELTEPVLPIQEGKAANGNAAFVFLSGSQLYNTAGNLGGTFPIGKIHNGELYFHGDLYTWIENSSLPHFQPRRIIYTLEPGYDLVTGKNEFRLFLKHQSYHNIDFQFGNTESYELFGLNYRKLTSPNFELRVAKYVDDRVVDYGWDFGGGVTFDLPKGLGHDAYARAWVHHVTDVNNSFNRNGFTDYALEYGFTVHDGFKLFARYEFLHDLDFFGGVADHHFIAGPMYLW